MNSRRRFEDFGQCVTLPSRWDGRRGRREQPTPPAPSTADTTSTGAIRRAGHDRTARAVVRQSPRYTSAGSARLGPPRSARPWARRSRPSAVPGSHNPCCGKESRPIRERLMPPRWREEGAGGGACRFRSNPGALAARRHRNRRSRWYQDRVGGGRRRASGRPGTRGPGRGRRGSHNALYGTLGSDRPGSCVLENLLLTCRKTCAL